MRAGPQRPTYPGTGAPRRYHPSPTRGAHRTSKHRLEMLKLGGLVRLEEKDLEAAGRRGRAGRDSLSPARAARARHPQPLAATALQKDSGQRGATGRHCEGSCRIGFAWQNFA